MELMGINDDVLGDVFGFIGVSCFRNVIQVCKRFKKICLDRRVWVEILRDYFQSDDLVDTEKDIISCVHGTRKKRCLDVLLRTFEKPIAPLIKVKRSWEGEAFLSITFDPKTTVEDEEDSPFRETFAMSYDVEQDLFYMRFLVGCVDYPLFRFLLIFNER